jgi:AcrR family transcriptional regulator
MLSALTLPLNVSCVNIRRMEKAAYHHGDLRNALMEAALAALERDGPDAVSLRELAAEVGVSRAAPYRHFPDRDALLAAVAAKGFEDLVGVYEKALGGPGDGRVRLKRALRGYMAFARSRPGLHALMFESDFLARTPPPEVMLGPANRAYELLWEGLRAAFPGAGETWIKARTVTMLSTQVGYLVLDNVGRFKPFMIEPLKRDDLIEIVLEAAIGAPP